MARGFLTSPPFSIITFIKLMVSFTTALRRAVSPAAHDFLIVSHTVSKVPETLQQLEIHSTATGILLVKNWEIIGSYRIFKDFHDNEWWISMKQGRWSIRSLSSLRKLSVQDSSHFHVRCDFIEESLGFVLSEGPWDLIYSLSHAGFNLFGPKGRY